MSEPIGFEREREVTKTKGLKISGKSSRFQGQVLQRQEKEKAKEEFEKKAGEFVENREEQQVKGVQLAKELMNSLRDKTLNSNKGILNKESEKEVRENLQHLVLDLNNDPEQKYDGMGSLTAIALIVKSLFEMRDRINTLEYQLSSLRKEMQSSPSGLESKDNG